MQTPVEEIGKAKNCHWGQRKTVIILCLLKLQSAAQTRHLGAIIDSDLGFYSQINKVIRSGGYLL